jgi:hypothetical protein
VRHAWLSLWDQNHRAMAFYEKWGLQSSARCPSFSRRDVRRSGDGAGDTERVSADTASPEVSVVPFRPVPARLRFYLLGTGAARVRANLLLGLVRLPPTHEIWIRVLGVVVFNVGIFYQVSAELNHRALYKASVFCRFLVMAAFLAFVGLKLAPPTLLIFGAVDLAGGVWTLMALLSDRWAGRVVTQI